MQANQRINISLAQSKRILGYTPRFPLAKGCKDYLECSRKFGVWCEESACYRRRVSSPTQ
jgi:hypothetical protein